MEKTCTKCKKVKPATLEFFHKVSRGNIGLTAQCRECKNLADKDYYIRNLEDQRNKKREYSRNNVENASKRSRKSYEVNRAKNLLRNRENSKKRYHSDPVYKLRLRIAGQLKDALSGSTVYGEKSKMYEIVGLTGADLVIYLWGTFERRYGIERGLVKRSDVEIDHIIPKSTAKTEEEVKKLNHYTNLQLLLKEDNVKKHTKQYVKGDENECRA